MKHDMVNTGMVNCPQFLLADQVGSRQLNLARPLSEGRMVGDDKSETVIRNERTLKASFCSFLLNTDLDK